MARRALLVPLLLTLFAAAATAQEVRQYRAGDAVDPREVAAILGQLSTSVPAIKMRSIRLLDDAAAPTGQAQRLAVASQAEAATAGAAVESSAGPAPRAASLSLPVQFGFDSAEILTTARHQLDALAEGIRMLPDVKSVVIQGHTDAAGADQYNELLSQRRAFAVKRYLVAAHGIDPSRLRAVGMGEYVPLPGRDPYAPENRRVQFRGE